MVTKNNYQLELYNGDLGVLEYRLENNDNFKSKAFFKINESIILSFF